MKRLFSIAIIAALALGSVSCSDLDYTEKYPNPSQTTTVTCEKLMTGIFNAGAGYTFKGYLCIFGWEGQGFLRYTQMLGFVNSVGRYEIQESRYTDRWNNFYNLLTQFRLLEYTYDNLPDVSKPNYKVFVDLSKVYMLDHLCQVVDTWGDVPYLKAGFLPITGDVATARPAYDKATDLYKTILDDLKTINNDLAAMGSPSDLTTGYLKEHDFINKGDLMRWRKYANSLRLRVAFRVSEQGELADLGKSVIKEILSDPTQYPLVDNNSETIKMMPDEDGFEWAAKNPEEGYHTWEGAYNRVSKYFVDALEDDPRLPILADENGEGNYIGIDMQTPLDEQNKLFDRKDYYSSYDSATFSRNRLLPGVMTSAAEVAFSKAEAYQKGYVPGDAKAEFIRGVILSVEFYYSVNATTTFREPTPAPEESLVRSFAEKKWNEATNKEEVILTQKWLHYGILQPVQSYCDIKRTGYPVFDFPEDASAQMCKNVPNRIKYPNAERDNNAENYEAVKSQDNFTDKRFWMK